ncbi:Uncharacterized protein Rs2_31577 [Raphanus sativus]|nr:hypothetical protein Rs2_31367 [Raphanus sativus]KAJ4891829.1 Uncharacterized protein Rs2_31577 [Raphanus sativus]
MDPEQHIANGSESFLLSSANVFMRNTLRILVCHCQWLSLCFIANGFMRNTLRILQSRRFKDPSLSCRLLSRLLEFEIDEAALSVDEDDKRRAKGRANKESYERAKGRANISPEYII